MQLCGRWWFCLSASRVGSKARAISSVTGKLSYKDVMDRKMLNKQLKVLQMLKRKISTGD